MTIREVITSGSEAANIFGALTQKAQGAAFLNMIDAVAAQFLDESKFPDLLRSVTGPLPVTGEDICRER